MCAATLTPSIDALPAPSSNLLLKLFSKLLGRRGHKVEGQTVLVTGAGSGIGLRMALDCARRGARRVIIWDMDAARAEEARAHIEATGVASQAWVVDVTDEEAVLKAAAEVGDVDILINNAGVVSGRTFLETSQKSVDRTLDVNVRSLYIVTRPFLKGMVERKRGTVVTVASAAGIVGVSQQTDYSASKWAAVGFAESLRMEMTKLKTGVNSISLCPYYIDTGMFDGVQSRFPWLFPILKQDEVSVRFIDAVERGEEQVVLPLASRLVFVGRLMPLPIFDRLCSFLGINSTMDHFTGRAGDRV